LQYAKSRVPGAEFFALDAINMQLDRQYDAVGMFDVLEHIPNDVEALKGVYRLLRPDGMLFITVPQHQWLWSPSDEIAHHCRRYARKDLLEKLERAGFSVVRKTSFVSSLLPAMTASRVFQSARKGDFDVFKELEISGAVGSVFETILMAELGVIKLGADLPLGGTLAVVAQKV
jgi:2-polyprenyl-3-methyl-5-hydroxy-6-metoxy-1,4-benzoquinol methylase